MEDDDVQLAASFKQQPGIPVSSFEKAERGVEVSQLEQQTAQQFEQEIRILVALPEGQEKTYRLKAGQEVAYIKQLIQDEFQIPAGKQQLEFQEKPMLDILSLIDINGISTTEVNMVQCKVA